MSILRTYHRSMDDSSFTNRYNDMTEKYILRQKI